MHNSKPSSRYTAVVVSLLIIFSVCSRVAAQTRPAGTPQDSRPAYPGKGLRLIKVNYGSPAERAGLKPMDVLLHYGDFAIVDDASFFAARDTYEHGSETQISIDVWREGKVLRMMVPPGRLGMETNEYNAVAYQLGALLDTLDMHREIPEYQRNQEFKDSLPPMDKVLGEARQLVDKAEQEATLTPTQILLARIYMVPDDASPEDLKRQSELMAQFLASQPVSYIHMLANDRFFNKGHNRPAVEFFKRYLESNPDDVAMRLNLGVAYYRLRQFAEAEAVADYVLEHDLVLEKDDYLAYNVKAMGVLSRGDYAKSIFFAEKSYAANVCHCDLALVMLAAAETGDVQKVQEARRRFEEELPEDFTRRQLQLVAVEALALVKNNQRERARELVQNWKDTDRAEGRLKSYWQIYPCGADVWNNWHTLAQQ
jgi:tetratricopeptide (TPR) repeat protein